jgi:hypothetical protein
MARNASQEACRPATREGGRGETSGAAREPWRRGVVAAVGAVAAVLSLVALVALAAGPAASSEATEAVSVGGQGGGSAVENSGVSKDAERVIQDAVRKAVAVRPAPPRTLRRLTDQERNSRAAVFRRPAVDGPAQTQLLLVH